MAQLHSASYSQSQSLRDVQINAVYADDEGREQNHSTNDSAVLAAQRSTCNGCGKVGHFSKVCRSKPKQKSRINMIDSHHKDSRLTTVLLKSMGKHGLHIAEQAIKNAHFNHRLQLRAQLRAHLTDERLEDQVKL
ncbi:hypothetical protein GJ496_010763 [Pomphorhynchus laevis]|nr:hypothetical protein GJ496_010763 [Pomphorhynchus laevis]